MKDCRNELLIEQEQFGIFGAIKNQMQVKTLVKNDLFIDGDVDGRLQTGSITEKRNWKKKNTPLVISVSDQFRQSLLQWKYKTGASIFQMKRCRLKR